MSVRQLNILVGKAVINREFRHALLNGQRREKVADFELTDEERDAVLAIRAETVQEFAQALERWLHDREADRLSVLGAAPGRLWG
jgi:hypothetical protein